VLLRYDVHVDDVTIILSLGDQRGQLWITKYTARGQPTHGFKIRHLGFARATVGLQKKMDFFSPHPSQPYVLKSKRLFEFLNLIRNQVLADGA